MTKAGNISQSSKKVLNLLEMLLIIVLYEPNKIVSFIHLKHTKILQQHGAMSYFDWNWMVYQIRRQGMLYYTTSVLTQPNNLTNYQFGILLIHEYTIMIIIFTSNTWNMTRWRSSIVVMFYCIVPIFIIYK